MARISAFRAAHVVLLLAVVPPYWYSLLRAFSSADGETRFFATFFLGVVLIVTAGYALTLGRPRRPRLAAVAIGDFAWFAFFGVGALLDLRGIDSAGTAYSQHFPFDWVLWGWHVLIASAGLAALVTAVMRWRAVGRNG
jgi:hypothetical protein